MAETVREIVLARPPAGLPRPEDFALREAPLRPEEGEVLVAVEWLAMDPYLRLRIAGRHLGPAVRPGEPIPGEGLGRVLASRVPRRFPVGSRVLGPLGWRERGWLPAAALRPLWLPGEVPARLALGSLGLPGLTAWAGLGLAGLRAGERLVVSAAAGTVGAVAAQLGLARRARVLGITAGAKLDYVLGELGLPAAVARDAPDFRARLAAALPEGLDVYFDNVGGELLDAALDHLRPGARVVLCGMIAQYNAAERPPGPNLGRVIAARARLLGLVVYDHLERLPEFLAEALPLWRAGRLRCAERIFAGLERAPEAFAELLSGRSHGRLLVRVGEEGAE